VHPSAINAEAQSEALKRPAASLFMSSPAARSAAGLGAERSAFWQKKTLAVPAKKDPASGRVDIRPRENRSDYSGGRYRIHLEAQFHTLSGSIWRVEWGARHGCWLTDFTCMGNAPGTETKPSAIG
jgi:hypothetical protein